MVRTRSPVQSRSRAPKKTIRSYSDKPATPMPTPRKPRKPCKNCSEPVKRCADTYCSKACLREYYQSLFVQQWVAGEVSGTRIGGVSTHIRRYLLRKHGEQCTLCGWNKRNPVTGKV